ncbi:MAG: hypothetical protein IKW39_02050, partial [Alphaproteobacteria bacterium]|nr:hypothetical protein [Alphaproteobacteria bacterium]
MAKKKRIINTGIITGALFFLGNHSPNTLPHEFSDITNTKKTPTEKVENPSEPNIEKKAQTPNASKIIPTTNTKQPASVKRRAPVRVYHRFEEIPEISDAEALFYNRKEYTYIVNADVYQKNGNIELKRVLKSELTKANALSLIYRSECETYNPKPNEDQISRYIVDLKILNPTGNYKGPSQMDDMAIVNFIKFL